MGEGPLLGLQRLGLRRMLLGKGNGLGLIQRGLMRWGSALILLGMDLLRGGLLWGWRGRTSWMITRWLVRKLLLLLLRQLLPSCMRLQRHLLGPVISHLMMQPPGRLCQGHMSRGLSHVGAAELNPSSPWRLPMQLRI